MKRQTDEFLARREELIAEAKGDTGSTPDHEWDGTKLRFQKPDGSWGEWVDLQGERGKPGKDGKNGKDGARILIAGGGGSGGTNLNALQPGVADIDPSALVVQQGGAWVNLPWSAFVTTIAGALDMAANAKRIDFVGETLMYRGEADPGSLDTDAVWRIKRVEFGTDGDVTETWANGRADFTNAWADRASLSYS